MAFLSNLGYGVTLFLPTVLPKIKTMEIVGYLLASLVGVSLGLIGSGGSILTVPILVYIMGVAPVQATAYSLLIVGSTALIGGIQSARAGKVDFKTVIIFGAPSILAVYATRLWLVPYIPDTITQWGAFTLTKPIALMLLFAVVMLMASVSMIKPGKASAEQTEDNPMQYNYPMILLEGTLVGGAYRFGRSRRRISDYSCLGVVG